MNTPGKDEFALPIKVDEKIRKKGLYQKLDFITIRNVGAGCLLRLKLENN